MKITCPSCSSNNQLGFGEHVVCGSCKKPFAGHAYAPTTESKSKKSSASVVAALILGAAGGYGVEAGLLSESRYPVATEYEIVNSCALASGRLLDPDKETRKTQACVCALEKTMAEIPFQDIEKSESKFSTRFWTNAKSCG